jgi:hypothetical protein
MNVTVTVDGEVEDISVYESGSDASVSEVEIVDSGSGSSVDMQAIQWVEFKNLCLPHGLKHLSRAQGNLE